MPDSVRGRVQRIIFNEGDYYVLNLVSDEGEAMAARGHIYGLTQIRDGCTIELVGRWTRHAKYGEQFGFKSWTPWAQTAEDVENFLHVCVEGFSDRELAKGIAEQFGAPAFAALARQPIPDGIPEEAALAWDRAVAVRDLSGMLATGGLSRGEVQAVMGYFGLEAASVVRDNPFRLMEIGTIPFTRVDKLALKLGGTVNDPRRIEGAILWTLRRQLNQGNLYLRRGKLPRLVNAQLRRENLVPLPLGKDADGAYTHAIQELVNRNALVLEQGLGVYLPEFYGYERRSAEMLARLVAPSDIGVEFEPFIDEYERSNHITLSVDQRKAVEELSKHRVLVLTGLPGTGKTTTIRALVRLFEEARLSFSLMAPTGIAAKRLSAVAGHSAATIHRALRYDGDVWGHNETNRYIVDAVIVDETSMVDQELLYRLLRALRPEVVLVLVGDDAQLPSVGAGNVLRELVHCPDVPSVRLTTIFRQSEKGEIVTSSHRINRGEMPELLNPRSETEFKFIHMADEDKIVDLIVKMAATLKSRDANFQILSPKYAGTVGVDNLNERLRDELNPEGPVEWRRGIQHFRLGDRLMVVRNDYERGVYNGDMCKLVRVGKRGDIVVKVHGISGGADTMVDFTATAAEEKLRLAYAVTVHKSQGNEFNTVILPIVRAQGRMLQRNLVYTAVTRARKQVWLIGEEAALQRAVADNKVVERNTALSDAITLERFGVEEAHES